MAYVTANLVCMVPRMSAGPAWWHYVGVDIHTDVDAAGFFTDGDAKGMKVGDLVFVSKSTATIGTTVHYVSAVTALGAATIEPAILA